MESIQEKLFPSNRFRLAALSPDAKEERMTVQLIRGHYTSLHFSDRYLFPISHLDRQHFEAFVFFADAEHATEALAADMPVDPYPKVRAIDAG